MSGTVGPRPESIFNRFSFDFDGTDEFVTMGNTINMAQDGSDAFSFSFWMKRTNGSGVQSFLGKVQDSGKGVNIYVNGTTIYMLIGTYSNACLFGSHNFLALNNGSWHHIAWTYDGSSSISGMKLYINNDPKTIFSTIENTPINLQNSSTDFIIGSRPSSFRYNGLIDEVSYFDSVLSASDVTTVYNGGTPKDLSSFSPISWWRCGDEANFSGGVWTLTDQGSGGNDGTSNNMDENNRVLDTP
jgi:hypothetical protein